MHAVKGIHKLNIKQIAMWRKQFFLPVYFKWESKKECSDFAKEMSQGFSYPVTKGFIGMVVNRKGQS